MSRPPAPFNGQLVSRPETVPWRDTGYTAERSIDIAGTVIIHHPAEVCAPPCPIHQPGEHHMVTWPLEWSHAWGELWRVCTHGDRHPDLDVLLFACERIDLEDCPCGCCDPTRAVQP